MGHLFVLEFSDGSIKVGHANEPAKRVVSSAKDIAERLRLIRPLKPQFRGGFLAAIPVTTPRRFAPRPISAPSGSVT